MSIRHEHTHAPQTIGCRLCLIDPFDRVVVFTAISQAEGGRESCVQWQGASLLVNNEMSSWLTSSPRVRSYSRVLTTRFNS